jgi:hypothetical protein
MGRSRLSLEANLASAPVSPWRWPMRGLMLRLSAVTRTAPGRLPGEFARRTAERLPTPSTSVIWRGWKSAFAPIGAEIGGLHLAVNSAGIGSGDKLLIDLDEASSTGSSR